MLLLEIVREVRVRHEVEPKDLHGVPPAIASLRLTILSFRGVPLRTAVTRPGSGVSCAECAAFRQTPRAESGAPRAHPGRTGVRPTPFASGYHRNARHGGGGVRREARRHGAPRDPLPPFPRR